jgi:hypothetical protein
MGVSIIMNFLAVWWASYVVFGVTALVGGILAVHNPPKEQTTIRWSYGIAFVVLFLLGLAVTKAQHDDSVRQVATASKEARNDEAYAINTAVQKAVQPYQTKIDGQAAQIDQLTRESHTISISNIVTGKKPIKVEAQHRALDPSALANAMRGFLQLQIRVKGGHRTSFQGDLVSALHIVISGAMDLGHFDDPSWDFEGVKVYATSISSDDRALAGANALVTELKNQNFAATLLPAKDYTPDGFQKNFFMVVIGNRVSP